MLTDIEVEAKRAEARQHKGVSYERDRDKFKAETTKGGRRHIVGRYETAAAAGLAYMKYVEANPSNPKDRKQAESICPPPEPPKKNLFEWADDVAEYLYLGGYDEMPLREFVERVWEHCRNHGVNVDQGQLTPDGAVALLRREQHRAKRFIIPPEETDGEHTVLFGEDDASDSVEVPADRAERRAWLRENVESSLRTDISKDELLKRLA